VPDADPTLLPLVALLCAIGLRLRLPDRPDGRPPAARLDRGRVSPPSQLVLFWLRYDYRVLERYKYVFGISAIVLLMLPSVPGLGQRVNGVKLWVDIGPLRFQPGEIAKIFLVIFLAGYLRDKREASRAGGSRTSGRCSRSGAARHARARPDERPRLALLNFGIFLAMVYAATGRLSFVLAGLALFAGGSALSTTHCPASSSASRSGCSRGPTRRSTARSTACSSTARTATRTSSSRACTRSRTAATEAPASAVGRSRPSTGRR
jgi:hypothetical protein